MNRQVDIKALVSHIVRGDGLEKCRICMGDTTDGQVYLGDTVMMDGERPVTLAELLEVITGIEVRLFTIIFFHITPFDLAWFLRQTERRHSLHFGTKWRLINKIGLIKTKI